MKLPSNIKCAYDISKTGVKFITINGEAFKKFMDYIIANSPQTRNGLRRTMYFSEQNLKNAERKIAWTIKKLEEARKS